MSIDFDSGFDRGFDSGFGGPAYWSLGRVVQLRNDNTNLAATVNGNFTDIRLIINRGLGTRVGHSHDNEDSRFLSGGLTGWTVEDLVLGNLVELI